MLGHFFLLIFFVAANFKYLFQEVKKVKLKIWIILAIIFLFGFYLRNSEYWMGGHTDGFVAGESARLWVMHGDFVKSCGLGDYQDCKYPEMVLSPAGLPFLIALVDIIFGPHSLNASIVSAVLSSLTIFLVFLFSYFLFKKESAGLYAALIFALIPLNIINSQTGESRPAGLFFAALSVIFYFLAIKNNKLLSWLAAATTLSYAIYTRQESYILVPLYLLFFVIYKWKEIRVFFINAYKKYYNFHLLTKLSLLVLTFIFLQLPLLKWMFADNPFNSYQGGGFYALHYKGLLIQGWAVLLQIINASPLNINIIHLNFLASLVFFAAMVYLLFGNKKNNYFVIGIFAAYFFVYSLMFDGNIQGTGILTGDYIRRTLMMHVPYAIIAGYGIYLLNPFKKSIIISCAALFILLVSLNFNFNHTTGKFELLPVKDNMQFYFPASIFKDARATKTGDSSLIFPDNSYWQTVEKIPNNCSVITSQYIIVLNDYYKDNKRKTVSIDLISKDTEQLFFEELKKAPCIYYLSDYRCRGAASSDYGCIFLKNNFYEKFEFDFKLGKVYSLKTK